MKSYIQGLITGGVFMFAVIVLSGFEEKSEKGLITRIIELEEKIEGNSQNILHASKSFGDAIMINKRDIEMLNNVVFK